MSCTHCPPSGAAAQASFLGQRVSGPSAGPPQVLVFSCYIVCLSNEVNCLFDSAWRKVFNWGTKVNVGDIQISHASLLCEAKKNSLASFTSGKSR